jgi:menaquinone-dependent protoporphyrinogen IX oxidase
MKAMIAYASWFGHNQAIAKALAHELAKYEVAVTCVPVSALKADDVADQDLLVLGTYTHAGHANGRLLWLCDTVARRQLEHMAIAVYGTQRAEDLRADEPGGVDELIRHLEARGFEIAVPPLRIGLRGTATFLPGYAIEDQDYSLIKVFARDLLEACVPAPLV